MAEVEAHHDVAVSALSEALETLAVAEADEHAESAAKAVIEGLGLEARAKAICKMSRSRVSKAQQAVQKAQQAADVAAARAQGGGVTSLQHIQNEKAASAAVIAVELAQAVYNTAKVQLVRKLFTCKECVGLSGPLHCPPPPIPLLLGC